MTETQTLHKRQSNHREHHSHDHHIHSSDAVMNIKAVWMFEHDPPRVDMLERLVIQIQDEFGKPIEAFQISHEKLIHLIVVSKDLSFFDHLHPQYEGHGRFHVSLRFPAGGDYKLIADFVPESSSPLTETHWVKARGDVSPATMVTPESEWKKSIDGKEISLTFDRLEAGQEVTMTFTFHDANTRQPITDLQPYLGAIGHVVAVSKDVEHYLHIHPLDETARGPHAKFMTSFPASGLYKIWGQFQHAGTLITVPFTIQVPSSK